MTAFRHWSSARITLLATAWVIGLPLALGLVASGLLATDFFIGVAWPELVGLAGLVVVPPLLLFVAWLWARARGDGDRDAPT